jgi:hypothetical protein
VGPATTIRPLTTSVELRAVWFTVNGD